MLNWKDSHHTQFLLVEPVNNTQYPPLGLMRISSMLKEKDKDCEVFTQIGIEPLKEHISPKKVFISSLFTWHSEQIIQTIRFYKRKYPNAEIKVGGIAASLIPREIQFHTGIKPHIGLYQEAENNPPDYGLTFNRKLNTSITFTSRGCRGCGSSIDS